MTQISGRAIYRALKYVMKAVPSDDNLQGLAHVVLLDTRIIGSNGRRWHIGHLPPEAELAKPLVIARESVTDLLLLLEYVDKVTRRHSGGYYVKLGAKEVTVSWGEAQELSHALQTVDVGHVPEKWKGLVPDNAPPITEATNISCGDMREAMSWYRAWDKDHGGFTLRGDPGGAVMVDITADGERVAQAYLLPADKPDAQLAPDDGLFADKAHPRGQSILDLQLDIPTPDDEEAQEDREAPAPKRRRGKKAAAAEAQETEQ